MKFFFCDFVTRLGGEKIWNNQKIISLNFFYKKKKKGIADLELEFKIFIFFLQKIFFLILL